MKRVKRSLYILVLASSVGAMSCATTSTSSTTWADPYADGQWTRPGRVEAVQQVVHRVEGNPAGGAVAGAVIGGLLFGVVHVACLGRCGAVRDARWRSSRHCRSGMQQKRSAGAMRETA